MQIRSVNRSLDNLIAHFEASTKDIVRYAEYERDLALEIVKDLVEVKYKLKIMERSSNDN